MIRHTQHAMTNGVLELFGMSVNLILIISFLTTEWNDKDEMHRKSFLTMLISSAVMQLGDGLCYILMNAEGTAFYRICQMTSFISFYVFMFQYFLYMYTYIRQRDRISPLLVKVCGAMCVCGASFWVFSAFSGQILSFRGDYYVRGPLYWQGQMMGGMIIFLTIAMAAAHRRSFPAKDLSIFVAYLVLPICGALLHYAVPEIMLVYPSVTLALVIVYVMMNARDETELRRQAEEERQRIVISRMQPDILLASLSDIREILKTDAEGARQAVDVFSSYLRENVDALSSEPLVKINGELAHLRNFLYLAERHCGERLKVSYNIGPTGFFMPGAVLQVLAEDVVSYIIRKGPEGVPALINVATDRTEGGYAVSVAWEFASDEEAQSADPDEVFRHPSFSNLPEIRHSLAETGGAELAAEPGRLTIFVESGLKA